MIPVFLNHGSLIKGRLSQGVSQCDWDKHPRSECQALMKWLSDGSVGWRYCTRKMRSVQLVAAVTDVTEKL